MFKQVKRQPKFARKRADAEGDEEHATIVKPVAASSSSAAASSSSSAARPAAAALSFGGGADGDDDDGEPLFKSKKKKRRALGAAPNVEWPPDRAVEAAAEASVGRRYDAAGMAALQSAQQSLPAEVARAAADEAAADEADASAADEVADDLAAQATRARIDRANQRDVAEVLEASAAQESFDVRQEVDDDSDDDGGAATAPAADFISLGGGKASQDAAHRKRWLQAGADADDVDAPRGADLSNTRLNAEISDDDDEGMAAWESELVARGSATGAVLPARGAAPAPFRAAAFASAAAAHPLDAPRRPKGSAGAPDLLQQLDLAIAQADDDASAAAREVSTREAQLDEQDASMAAAVAESARAANAIATLRKACGILATAVARFAGLAAVEASPASAWQAALGTAADETQRSMQLRSAMKEAIGLSAVADGEPLAVYANAPGLAHVAPPYAGAPAFAPAPAFDAVPPPPPPPPATPAMMGNDSILAMLNAAAAKSLQATLPTAFASSR
ncbi:hypothetical protein M885DRAFT_617674 [Pelagophyceae sp. CCMP2097]|nr:hypothetical protein M885DRAFT_617674 [Pelagophyceae sp. CCMP2097]